MKIRPWLSYMCHVRSTAVQAAPRDAAVPQRLKGGRLRTRRKKLDWFPGFDMKKKSDKSQNLALTVLIVPSSLHSELGRYVAEMWSGSKEGSCLRLIDCWLECHKKEEGGEVPCDVDKRHIPVAVGSMPVLPLNHRVRGSNFVCWRKQLDSVVSFYMKNDSGQGQNLKNDLI